MRPRRRWPARSRVTVAEVIRGRLGGIGGTRLAVGVRWSFRGKDAGSVRTWKVWARLRTQHRGEQRAPATQPSFRQALPVPIYWKPKYGTRSSRHRAWVRQETKREAAAKRGHPPSLRRRLKDL